MPPRTPRRPSSTRPGASRPAAKASAPPRTPSPRGAASAKPQKAEEPAPRRKRMPLPDDDRPGAMRLQKLLSAAGIASRRTAESLIAEGRVTVNGTIVDTLGAKAVPDVDDIRVDDRRVKTVTRQRYILLNKPRGYVTTREDPEGRRTVMDLLRGVREYVYPVGRLDYDTEGLLLLTSDGDLAAKLTHPRHEIARIYEAIVMGEPSDDALDELRRGIFLDGRRTAEAGVMRGSTVGKGRETTSKIVLTLREGRNRQVREMCQRIGHPVRTLERVRMGPLSLRGLPTGHWRDLTAEEVTALRTATSGGGSGRRKA